MQANPNPDLDTQYDNLTEKQKAVIDAYAQNPDETNREIARIAGEEILGDDKPVNESYCSEIINKDYPELAEYRAEIEQNERVEGTEQTVGDPFAQLQQEQQEWQTIQERPKKSVSTESDSEQSERQEAVEVQPVQSTSPVQIADVGDGIVIKLSYRYVKSLLESQEIQLPKELHEQLVDVVLQRAFN